MIADIDHFKHINDSFGHLAGDAVLVEISKRLQGAIRLYDSVGRYGGEEFLFVAPGSDLAGGQHLAERLRVAVSSQPIETAQGPIHVTVSLGVATTTGTQDADSLIHAADVALYRAKHAGRNRVELATVEPLTGVVAG